MNYRLFVPLKPDLSPTPWLPRSGNAPPFSTKTTRDPLPRLFHCAYPLHAPLGPCPTSVGAPLPSTPPLCFDGTFFTHRKLNSPGNAPRKPGCRSLPGPPRYTPKAPRSEPLLHAKFLLLPCRPTRRITAPSSFRDPSKIRPPPWLPPQPRPLVNQLSRLWAGYPPPGEFVAQTFPPACCPAGEFPSILCSRGPVPAPHFFEYFSYFGAFRPGGRPFLCRGRAPALGSTRRWVPGGRPPPVPGLGPLNIGIRWRSRR